MSPQGTKIATAIAATAAITLVFASIFFFLYYKFCISRRRQDKNKAKGSFRREDVTMARDQEFKRPCRNVKELNGCGNGKDVFSLRKQEGGQVKTNFPKFVFNPSYNGGEEEEEEEEAEAEEKRVDAEGEKNHRGENFKPQEAPLLLHELSSDLIVSDEMISKPVVHNIQTSQSPTSSQSSQDSFTLAPPIVPEMLTPLSQLTSSIAPSTPPPQYPPPPPPTPPPPPPPPLPQPIPVRAKPALQPPAPTPAGWISSRRTPIALKDRATMRNNSRPEAALTEESSNGKNIAGQKKLKPLHWDKVTADVDHSTVWDEINDGSLRFDDELMENLFGYSTTSRQSSERNNIFSALTKSNSGPPTQVFILDPRKSQNTAIVLRSLAISRREILDALVVDGQELGADTLEKLVKISPTQEEASKILNFNGNPSKLADAESFLYHILTSVPSAFTRLNAMLFRANYDPEILHFKEALQTLELGCQELRSRGLFLKLLEVILKAGNKMNAGTSRGNAQGFNLNALKKLSDIRSNDGKTSLLHFVVEQVARSEGKRSLINQDYQRRISTITNQRTHNNFTTEEKEKEYLLLGLPMLEGLSKELSNVKKAATIDYESSSTTCDVISSKVAEIRKVLSRCDGDDDKAWFAREMKGFLEECEEEIKVVREEQNRVLELVKRTTEYYQAGVSKGRGVNPFHLFVLVKDFLDMVDQVCVETCRKIMQKRTTNATSTGGGGAGSGLPSSPPLSPSTTTMRFSNFNSHFMSDLSLSSSCSDSEDEF